MENPTIEVIPTGLYPIGKAAAILGIDRGTLRRKTMEGLIKCQYRRGTGRKVYKGSEITRFHESHM